MEHSESSEQGQEETHDPGTSETPTGVPPAGEEPAQNAEIDEQPEGFEDAESGEEDEDEGDDAPDASGASV